MLLSDQWALDLKEMEDTTYLFIEFDVDNRVALQMV